MARVEVLAVGKELLIGRTLNTNAHWLGRRLALLGGMIKEMATVDDDLGEISTALRSSLARRPDALIVTGGLGPTPDDMTLKGVALGLGTRVLASPEAMRLLKEHYSARGLGSVPMTPARRKMAALPSGAEPLRNPVGTAPGARIEAGGTIVYCLPGVPAEMKAIFRESVEPEVREMVGPTVRRYVSMKLEGVYESALAPVIARELKKHPGAYIKSHPRGTREGVSRIELDVAVVGSERKAVDEEAERIAKAMVREAERLGGALKSARRGR
jgi:molybdenum cofactor synthesis domain-containing protein